MFWGEMGCIKFMEKENNGADRVKKAQLRNAGFEDPSFKNSSLQESFPNKMKKILSKRNTKDSVFCDLFEDPKYLLQLYQSLHPEDTEVTVDQISNVTLKNVLLDQMYNDLGFVVGSRLLVLVEAQSTWSVNIAVRALMYLANTWQEYIEEKGLNIYGSKKISLPRPELYVVYTGDRKEHPEWVDLSEEFFAGQDPFVNVKVKVLYGDGKHDIISQYVTFTKVYNEQVKLLGRTKEAVLETIRICKQQDVLVEYLTDREKEVVNIMITLFDQEYALKQYGKELKEEGIALGRQEGREETIKEMIYQLAEMGIPTSKIAQAVGVDISVVEKWLKENAVVTK